MDPQRAPSHIESIPEDSSVEDTELAPREDPSSPTKISSSSSSLSKEQAPSSSVSSPNGALRYSTNPPSTTMSASRSLAFALPPKQLSVTSKHYDVGKKGFLTPAEQTMRDMDTHGQGQLTNEQVASIVEQTMSLRDVNSRLRFWVLALFGAVIILALSNLGTAFAAARLAKDTTVNESTGVMVVKGKNTPVVIRSSGSSIRAVRVTLPNGDSQVCINMHDAARLMNRTMEGTKTTIVVENGEGQNFSVVTVGVSASGSSYGSFYDTVCFGRDDGSDPMCTDFQYECKEVTDSNGRRSWSVSPGRRLQKGHPSHPIHEFHAVVKQGFYDAPPSHKDSRPRRSPTARALAVCKSTICEEDAHKETTKCSHDTYADAWDENECDQDDCCLTPLAKSCSGGDGWHWTDHCQWEGDGSPYGFDFWCTFNYP